MLYSDEDKLSEDNERFAPFFKPDWSPESFLSRMYTCHFGLYRTSIVRRIGGFRRGVEGSQDYDLVLRFTEQTQNVVHVPRVLYHWRMHSASTAQSTDAKPYAFIAAKKALAEALKRRNQPGRVLDVPGFMGHYRVRYEIKGSPKATIIIPTRDYAHVLGRCLQSLFTRTKYPRYEVIVVDNGSVRPETAALFDKWTRARPGQFKVVRDDRPFNFSALCNVGAKASDGRFLCFLNNDTEITEPDWLEGLVEYAQHEDIGAVGPKLLYGDGTVQHCGVVLGLGGTAGHPHVGTRGTLGGYYGYAVCSNNVAAVTGACLVVERNKFDRVGGFDEELAIAYNDVDLCVRLLDSGLRNVVLPNVTLLHHESRSRGSDMAPEKWSRMTREGAVLRQRWAQKFWRDPYYSPNLSLGSPHFELSTRGERRGRPDAWSARVHQLGDVGHRQMVAAERAQVRLAPVVAERP
jgi:GT2 family glycosyltransferase